MEVVDVVGANNSFPVSSLVGTRLSLAFTERFLSLFIKFPLVGDVGDVGRAAGGGSWTEDSLRAGV